MKQKFKIKKVRNNIAFIHKKEMKMLHKNNITKISLGFVITLILASCNTQKRTYERPEIEKDIVYRTDELSTDSLSIATKSWREIFTDSYLQSYIQKSLENNMDIRIAEQSIVSAEAYLKQSKQAIAPTLNIGRNYTLQSNSLNSIFGQIMNQRRFFNQFDFSAALSWSYNLGNSYEANRRAQQAAYLNSVATHQAIKTNLVASVATTYYQLLALDEQKRILESTLDTRKKNVETNKALKISGIVTEVAVKQSEALIANVEAQLLNLKNQTEVLENALNILLGESPKAVKRGTFANQTLPKEFSTGYPAQLLSNRPDVMAAEFNLIQAFELTNVAKAAFYPSLNIGLNTGLQGIDLDKFFSANSLFGTLTTGILQPILRQRQIKTQYEVRLANQQAAYLNFRKKMLVASQEVSDALSTYGIQENFIKLKNKELEAYQKSEEYSEELLKYGMVNYLEVLTANVNRLNAELNIVNAEYNQMKSLVNLYQALGGGWK